MMKKSMCFGFAIALVFCCFSSGQAFAQKLSSDNSFLIEAGVGIVPGGGNNDFYSWEIPPLKLTAEMAIVKGIFGDKDFIVLGLGGGYFKYAYMDTSYDVGHIQALVNYRYPLTPRLTAWAGYTLGYYFDSYNRETELFSGYDGLFSEVYLGLGYYFYKNIGAFAKVSTGEALVEAGISMRW
jgi:hypothetical protein